MTRVYISREDPFMGPPGLLHCYIDDLLIAKIDNGKDATYDTEADTITFRCHISSGHLSDVYTLGLAGRKMLAIFVKVGSKKPKITVTDSNAIVHIQTVTGMDGVSTEASGYQPFVPTKKVGYYFAMDDNSKQWAVAKGFFPSTDNCVPYKYSDLVDFELLEDGDSIIKGGLGRAVVGGVLFGGLGAIVGGVTGKRKGKSTCTSLMIKITVNNTDHPVEYIKFITSSTRKDSFTYKTEFKRAQEIMSLLQLIVNQQREAAASAQTPPVVVMQQASAVDEIRKLKELMDDGIISQEEFEAKKKQLLGL